MTIAEQPASGRDEDPGDRALRTLAERAVKAARAELRGERAGILGVVGQSGLALQGRAKTVPDRWSVIHVMDRMEEAFRILGRLPLPTRPRGYINSMPTYLYAHNPEAIGEIAYGGRMGNAPPPAPDGYVYRGRGLSQCTGKEGYAKLGKKLGLDLVGHPDLINDPDHVLECGVADWIICGCLPHALADDIIGETKALNGGLIGLPDRRIWVARWKRELGVSP